MDFYKVLNVSRNSSSADIKKAFRKLALIYHPDVNGSDESKTQKYKQITKAYETLYNENLRNQYDRDHGINRFTETSSTHTSSTQNSSFNSSKVTRKTMNYEQWKQSTNRQKDDDAEDIAYVCTTIYRNPWMDLDSKYPRSYGYFRRKQERERATKLAEAEKLMKSVESDAIENLRQKREERRKNHSSSYQDDNSCSIQ